MLTNSNLINYELLFIMEKINQFEKLNKNTKVENSA